MDMLMKSRRTHIHYGHGFLRLQGMPLVGSIYLIHDLIPGIRLYSFIMCIYHRYHDTWILHHISYKWGPVYSNPGSRWVVACLQDTRNVLDVLTKPFEACSLCGVFQALNLGIQTMPGWWFGTFFVFYNIWNSNPNWLIFFRRGWNHQPDA